MIYTHTHIYSDAESCHSLLLILVLPFHSPQAIIEFPHSTFQAQPHSPNLPTKPAVRFPNVVIEFGALVTLSLGFGFACVKAIATPIGLRSRPRPARYEMSLFPGL